MGRKTMWPTPTASGGNGTGLRVLGALVGLTLFALLLRDPVGAAGTVERVGTWCGQAIDSLARFGVALSS